MAVVKFLSGSGPVKNVAKYVMNKEKTLAKLISGKDCMPESAVEEFQAVKQDFGKTDGRQYYHIIQSFSPEDDLTPETAHEIGMQFAAYFTGYQALVVTHINKNHLHNHIVLNSVNFENGKKFHQSAEELRVAKVFSNNLCREHGLSTTEEKAMRGRRQKWKDDLLKHLRFALSHARTKEDFIETLQMHGYDVKWADNLKYVTFTTPDGHKCRDNKLFDERFLKDNMETYFAMGGCASVIAEPYQQYETPSTGSITTGLCSLLDSFLGGEVARNHTRVLNRSQEQLEKMEALGLRVSPVVVEYVGGDDEEEEQGMSMSF